MEEPAGLVLARTVASWGWEVAPGFCSRQGEKIPLAGDWVNNATTDVNQLEKWWAARSWLWPGVVSGVNSCLVIDCDTPEAVAWLSKLASQFDWDHGGLIYKTPGRGGGLHCIWTWPEFLRRDFRQAKVYLEGGGEVQVRGNGHWTLLAGAKRPDGIYEIIEEPGPYGPIVAPEQLIRSILRESVVSTGRTQSSELEEISPEAAWEGAPYSDGRKNLVAGIAWYLAIRGTDSVVVEDTCIRFGRECCVPELGEETCQKKAEYAILRAERIKAKQQIEMERSIGRWAKGRVWRST